MRLSAAPALGVTSSRATIATMTSARAVRAIAADISATYQLTTHSLLHAPPKCLDADDSGRDAGVQRAAGGNGAKNAPIKPDWNAKISWNIAPERLRSDHNIGAGPVMLRVKAEVLATLLKARAAPDERFLNAGPSGRDWLL